MVSTSGDGEGALDGRFARACLAGRGGDGAHESNESGRFLCEPRTVTCKSRPGKVRMMASRVGAGGFTCILGYDLAGV